MELLVCDSILPLVYILIPLWYQFIIEMLSSQGGRIMKNIMNNTIEVGEVKQMKRNRKKKGFTLVELIAVIAILGILAAIIVPKVGNYTAKATDAKNLANAKTIAQAVEMYNTDQTNDDNLIIESTPLTAESGLNVKDALMPSSGTKYLSSWPTNLPDGWSDYGDVLELINNGNSTTDAS